MRLKRMGLLDAYALLGESTTVPYAGGGLQIFRKPKGVGRNFVDSLYEEMRTCAVTGSPCNYRPYHDFRKGELIPQWEILEPGEIDLDYHFRRWALPGKRDMAELNRLVSYITSQPLDHSRPLWEVHLIEAVQGNRFAIFTKVHHALFDGIRGIQWMISGLTADSRKRKVKPMWTVSPPESVAKERGRLESYKHGLAQALNSGPVVGSLVKGVVESGIARWQGESALASPYSAPETILNHPVTALRTLGNCSLSREKIDRIAEATGTTANDVMLTIFGGALDKHLEEVDHSPGESLIAMVPKGLKGKGSGSGNAAAPMFISLGTDISDPLERLRWVHDSSAAGKKLITEMHGSALPLYAATILLPTVLAPLSDEHSELRRMANLTVSNVPGTKDKLYLKGAELESWYIASILQPGNGLNITIVNYAGHAQVGVISCPDILPDIDGLARRFPRELDALARSVSA